MEEVREIILTMSKNGWVPIDGTKQGQWAGGLENE